MSPRRRARRRRGGYVLVFVAMMAVGLFGLAAVVIDLGLARATQAQMQSAADAAALEGLRWRDDLGWPAADPLLLGAAPAVLEDPDARDLARRQRASDLVARRFDAELDLDATNDELDLGAGPVITLSGGLAGDLNASALLTVDPANRTYDPVLQVNLGDETHGDLVAGDWLELVTTHGEDVDYVRDDFEPQPAATTAAVASSAFLARLRRTTEPPSPGSNPFDRDANVSSSGPALPFLFGLGTSIRAEDPVAAYQPRRDGITVRATAIADGRPVLAVGQPSPPSSTNPSSDPIAVRFGVTPFSLDRAWWSDVLVEGAAVTLTVVGSSLLDGVATVGTLTPVSPLAGVTAVGMSFLDADAAQRPTVLDSTLRGEGYVPIVHGPSGVVVGFGWVSVAGGGGPPGLGFTVTRRARKLAPENATAVASGLVTPRLAVALGQPRGLLTEALDELTRLGDGALLAPALVR